MTITQDASSPLVVVVGGTGVQGGSVVKALAESDRPYRVRVFSRDATKPAAHSLVQLGVEVVELALTLENKDAVYKAFAGAEFAFLMTNWWVHFDTERDIAEGKLLVDAAKAGGASRVVWSGLPAISRLSGGKYPHVWHFDSKAAVTEYGRQAGVPFLDLQAGNYGTNFLGPPFAPTKQADGSYVIALPVKPTMQLPIIDAAEDYGLFVRHALELPVFPDGAEIVAYSENVTITDVALHLSQRTGKNVVFKQISADQFHADLAALGFPPPIVLDLAEVFLSLDELGWKVDAVSEGLARRPRTWAEIVEVTDWSKVVS
ncbi:NAD(P)-binding protein [Mycena maculata]|uniref:NAD(P)-binding protein n=1 Tax=Mycena maculata TaxID=230809 RepID=A0AAD7I7I3_9AGAR|nr:NAD(P)-binding protein [Mycena maculata]